VSKSVAPLVTITHMPSGMGRPSGKAAPVNSSVRFTAPSVTHTAAKAPSFCRSASSTYATIAPTCRQGSRVRRC